MSASLGRAIRAWLVLRAGLAAVVLGLVLSFLPGGRGAPLGSTPLVIFGLVGSVLASSFVVAAYLVRLGRADRAATSLLLLDVLVVTGVIAISGGAGSVFSVLYGAVIVASATTMGGRAAFLAGGLSLACYGVVGIGMALGYLPHPPDQGGTQYLLNPSDLAFSALSNLTALVIVTFLSSWLAVQLDRKGGELAVSEETRRRLSALNEDVVRSIGSGLVTLDRDDRITSINPAGLEMLRIDAQHALAAPLHGFFPDLASRDRTSDDRAETFGLRADATPFPAGYSLSPLRDAAGEPSGTLLAFRDLTEVKQLEEAARSAERLATLGRIAAILAHEIRNPLGSISGSVELVRENPSLGDEDRHLLTLIVGEVERLDELVSSMLDLARPREPRRASIDARRLAEDVCTMVRAGLGAEAGVAIRVSGDEPCEVVADADMLRQILWNLVKNAVQSSPRGEEVEVRLARDDAGYAIEVLDHGPGVGEADRSGIFEPFRTGRTRGIGLGLTLVKQLVDAHRGTIEVTAREPHGARFALRMPRLEPSPQDRTSLA